jgi:hypothetical protein
MQPSDLAQAKSEISQSVDVNAGQDQYAPPKDTPTADAPPAAPATAAIKYDSDTTIVNLQGAALLPGGLAPMPSPEITQLSGARPAAITAPVAAPQTQAASTEPQGITVVGASRPVVDGEPVVGAPSLAAAPTGDKLERKLDSIVSKEGEGSTKGDTPVEAKPETKETVAKTEALPLPIHERGKANFDALTAAVGTIPDGEFPGELVTAGIGDEFHITGDFSGGKIIAGNFGEGVAGVRVKRSPAGFTLTKLTRGQLAVEYLRLVVLWMILLAPLFYGSYLFGRRKWREPSPFAG